MSFYKRYRNAVNRKRRVHRWRKSRGQLGKDRIYLRHENDQVWWNMELWQPLAHGPFTSIAEAKADVLREWRGKRKLTDFSFVQHFFGAAEVARLGIYWGRWQEAFLDLATRTAEGYEPSDLIIAATRKAI